MAARVEPFTARTGMMIAALAAIIAASYHLIHAQGPEFTSLPDGATIRILPPASLPSPPSVRASEFVTRRGKQLIYQGKPWYFLGFNAYWFVDAASWGGTRGRQQVAETLSAAKGLGMRVVRTWAFNSQLPAGANTYDEGQFQALDYIIYATRLYGLKLILPLGNFWAAYKSPEEFVSYAMGPAGRGILDFYSNPSVVQLYKSHISAILNRVNTFTGLAYRDDPTIMGWDVLNEPRCPGCESPDLQNLVVKWMRQMTNYTSQLAPRQMVALGTEGFFMNDRYQGVNLVNPGPGAQCEGEDWPRIAALPAVDYLTLHVYERHMEWQPVLATGRLYNDPDWIFCGFNCYINWFVRYVKAHNEVAQSLPDPKPVLIEEFGLTWWSYDVRDRRVLFAVIGQMLADSAASGGALAGVMLWNGAHNDSPDQDGYNVFLNRKQPKALPSPPPPLQPLPPILPYLAAWVAELNTGVHGPEVKAAQGRRLQSLGHADDMDGDGILTPLHNGTLADAELMGTMSDLEWGGRELQWQMDKLDGFRRGWERGYCAHEASRRWRPPLAWTNISRAGPLSAEAVRWMAVRNLQAWRDSVWPLEEVDLLKWAADRT